MGYHGPVDNEKYTVAVRLINETNNTDNAQNKWLCMVKHLRY